MTACVLIINRIELVLQKYLKSDCFLSDDKKCIFYKCRVRELDVKLHYRNKYQNQNLQCSLCLSGENDSQYHLFHCSRLIDNCENLANNISIEYEDLFSDISLQIPAAKLLSEIWKVRKKILEDQWQTQKLMTNSSLDWPVHSSCCATGDTIFSF